MTRLRLPCFLVLALTACAAPPPPLPPPVVQLAPAEGTVLTVEVFRLPDGVTWDAVAAYCADGLRRPGDIEVRDRRKEPDAADAPCFRVAWANGLPQRWEGCGCDRFGSFELCGVAAARALAGTWVANLARNQLWRMSGAIAVDALGEVGWWEHAEALAEREWVWHREARYYQGAKDILGSAMRRLHPDRRSAFHEVLVRDAIERVRLAQEAGDRDVAHRASFMLVSLGEGLPAGSSAAAFVRHVRGADVLDAKNLTKVLRALRPQLVAEPPMRTHSRGCTKCSARMACCSTRRSWEQDARPTPSG